MTAGVPLAVEQELVAHVFAPVDGPLAGEAHSQIRLMWSRCRGSLGMTEPIRAAGLTSRLPGDFGGVPESAAIAAQQSPGIGFQAVLRREHDVLNLSVLLARTDETGQSPPLWTEFDRLLDTVLGDRSDTLIGVALLYLAKVTDAGADTRQVVASARLGSALSALLPSAPQETGWWHRGLTTAAGLAVWEISARQDTRAERRFVAVAPSDRDPELSAWTWSRGDALMPPFARYLMHAAKIRYELRVRDRFPPVAQLCQRADDSIADIRALVSAVTAKPWPAGGDQRDALTGRLAGLQADRVRLAEMSTTLKAMARTVETAEANGVTALGSDVPDGTGNQLIGDDRALARWFGQQLDDDLTYLEASLAGARQVTEIAADVAHERQRGLPPPGPAFGIITALAEEFTAMRTLISDREQMTVDGDRADYVLGTVPSRDPGRPHRVVLTMLGETGNDAAANACASLVRSFGSVGYVLMVGIAAGVPDPRRPDRHVRLGDVVVASWGIAEYDSVTDEAGGPVSRRTFPSPSSMLGRHAKMLEANELEGRRPWEEWLVYATGAFPMFGRPPAGSDVLYASDDAEQPVPHPDAALSGHRPGWPKVHYGVIGSGDRSLRSARKRDELAAAHDVLAIEMEGKGIGNTGFSVGVEWLVIRGISDYGDHRASRVWRGYASLAAAAYTRALLAECPPTRGREGPS